MNAMLISQNHCIYLNSYHYLEGGEVNVKKQFKILHIFWHPSVWKKKEKKTCMVTLIHV